MADASQFLAKLSHHTSVVVAPDEPAGRYKHIEFVRLRGSLVLIIFVTNSGAVLNKLVEIDEPLSQHDLNSFSTFLDEELEHLTLPEIRQRLLDLLREDKAGFLRLLEQTFRASQEVRERDTDKVFIGGTSQLFDTPEFADVEKLRSLVRAFEDKDKFLKLLDKSSAARGRQGHGGRQKECPSA